LHLGKELNLWDLIENQQLVNKLLLVAQYSPPLLAKCALCAIFREYSALFHPNCWMFQAVISDHWTKTTPFSGLGVPPSISMDYSGSCKDKEW